MSLSTVVRATSSASGVERLTGPCFFAERCNGEKRVGANKHKERTRGALVIAFVRREVSVDKDSEFKIRPVIADEGVLAVIQCAVDEFHKPVEFLGFEGRPCMEFLGESVNCAEQIMANEPSAI
jgi:hypothetical protein